jgi:recombination protein RecR
MQIEKTGAYRGLYHVLMGHLSPIDGVEPGDLRMAELTRRVEAGGVEEVILALNPNLEGDATASYLAKQLGPRGVRLTRPARGLPAGSEIEFADERVLTDAMTLREPFAAGGGR